MNEERIIIDGTAVEILPIYPDQVDKVVLRCWPDKEAIVRIFAYQEILGFAAWKHGRCVGQLHCYRIDGQESSAPLWPFWSNWWDRKAETIKSALGIQAPMQLWCHACFHVGRTMESSRDEFRTLISKRVVPEVGNDLQRVLEKLDELCVCNFNQTELSEFLEELSLRPYAPLLQGGIERKYQGKGIGTALCKASLLWAQTRKYRFALGLGGTPNDHGKAERTGQLSAHTYEKLGFMRFDLPCDTQESDHESLMVKKFE